LLLPQKSFAEIVHHARAGHAVLAEALVG
jgi:hypothetical protein